MRSLFLTGLVAGTVSACLTVEHFSLKIQIPCFVANVLGAGREESDSFSVYVFIV